MIFDILSNAERYYSLHPDFSVAFQYLREAQSKLDTLNAGRHEIIPGKVYAIVSWALGKGQESAKLETHQKFIDIQWIAKGTDIMGWKNLGTCLECSEAYQAERDIAFYADIPELWFSVPTNHFAIFFPEDAHAPLAGLGDVAKIVMKVAVQEASKSASPESNTKDNEDEENKDNEETTDNKEDEENKDNEETTDNAESEIADEAKLDDAENTENKDETKLDGKETQDKKETENTDTP